MGILTVNRTGRAAAARKGATYDNPRENIDPHVRTKVISTQEFTSGATVIGDFYMSGSNFCSGSYYGDGSQLTGVAGGVSDTDFQAVSGAHVNLSGAYQTFISDYDVVSGAHTDLSGAYYTHEADASDPHGATLTQSIVSLTSGAITGDMETSGSVYIAPVIFSGAGTAPTASDYPKGTLFIGYTA